MKKSEIYLRAAEIVANPTFNYGCCNALCRAATDFQGPLSFGECGDIDDKKYLSILKDFKSNFGSRAHGMYWWARQEKKGRLIALCLAAAIAESEGD